MMPATIASPDDSFTCEVLNFELSSSSTSVLHTASWYTVGVELAATGELPLLFASLADALEARSIMQGPGPFTLSYEGLDDLDLTFVRESSMTLKIAEDREHWYLYVGIAEVTT